MGRAPIMNVKAAATIHQTNQAACDEEGVASIPETNRVEIRKTYRRDDRRR